MSQVEALLNSLTEDIPVHDHLVKDPDSYFIIDPDTREIDNASQTRNVLMQYDHNSEVYTFELPRIVEGHDMTLCNRVRVHFNNIDGQTLEERPDVVELYDLAVSETDPEKVICSWTIERYATQLAGTLNFLVQYECIDDEGNSVYEWHTDIYDDVIIKSGRNYGEAVVLEYSNVLEQWYQRLFGTGESILTNIQTEGENQVTAIQTAGADRVTAVEAAIQLKGEETLATIPADYTEVYNMADEALRTKADAIVLNTSGEDIFVDDSSNDYVKNLKLFGKTTQRITTGKNLLDDSEFVDGVSNGVAVTKNSDGSYTATGTASTTNVSILRLGKINMTAETKYRISGAVSGMRLSLRDETIGAVYADDTGEGTSYTPSEDTTTYLYARVEKGDSINATFYPMVQLDSLSDDTWEPYTGGVASPNPAYPQPLMSVENPLVMLSAANLISPVDVIAGDISVPSNRIHCGPSCTLVVNVTKTRVEGVEITNNRLYPCVLLEMDESGVESATYPESVSLPSGSGTYTVTFVTKPTTKSVRVNFTNNNSDKNLNTHVSNTAVMLLGVDCIENDYVETQSIIIDRTIPGIPVTSGGNYTDANGQQWICDEIDFERGVYVQRVEHYVYDGSDDESWKNGYSGNGKNNRFEIILMGTPVAYKECESNAAAIIASNAYCSHFGYQETSTRPDVNKFRISKSVTAEQNWWYVLFSPDTAIVALEDLDAWRSYLAENPITVMIPLATPIETPLTEEEIYNFRKLKTNYHNTTVLNDAGTHMELDYVADTLIFLRDNQPVPTDEQVQVAVNEYVSQNGVQVPSDDHIRSIVDEVLGGIVNDEY